MTETTLAYTNNLTGSASLAPELVRVLTHPVTGMVITADTYRPTASLRRYLEHRDKHCQFPVCNRDARYADIDHTVPWEHGGKTVPENLAVLCRGHHTLKHHGGWSVKQISPGVLEWTTPLGRVIRSDGTRGDRVDDPDAGDPGRTLPTGAVTKEARVRTVLTGIYPPKPRFTEKSCEPDVVGDSAPF